MFTLFYNYNLSRGESKSSCSLKYSHWMSVFLPQNLKVNCSRPPLQRWCEAGGGSRTPRSSTAPCRRCTRGASGKKCFTSTWPSTWRPWWRCAPNPSMVSVQLGGASPHLQSLARPGLQRYRSPYSLFHFLLDRPNV